MEPKKRFDNLDLIKAFAICMVVSLHVDLWKYDFISMPTASQVFQYGCRLFAEGVPLFITVNGFLMLRKETFDLKKHINKMLKLFGLLMFWAVVLAITGFLILKEPFIPSLKEFAIYIFETGIGARYTSLLWFLQNLLALYLIFPLLWKAYHSDFQIFKYFFVVLSVLVLGVDTLGLIRDYYALNHDPALLDTMNGFLWRFSSIGNEWYVFYFCMGGMIYHYLPKLKEHRILLSVVGLLSWPVATFYGYLLSTKWGFVYNPSYNYGSVFMVLFITGFMMFTLPFDGNKNIICKFICSLGKNTFGIYVIHVIYLRIYLLFFTINTLDQRVLAFCSILLASYLTTLLLSKIPGVKKIISLS